MDDADIDGEIEHAAATLLGAGWTWHRSRFWLTACPDDAVLSRQGWKLHVSCRANEFADLVGLIVPVLRVERCVFKLAASRRILVGLNDGVTAPATVGKAVTVYPDATRVRAVGLRLAELLRGRHGPRVLSDRQVLPDAPVYYRYGPFTNAWRADARGRLVTRLYGGDGESFDALATLAYRRPGWATDPFTGESEDATAEPDEPLGGRYRIVAGIREAARGNVYRAIDERDGGPAVVKQARALVDEHASGADVRMRLRNERRVLQALDGMAGVPRFIDHFRHGEDEFLVTSDEGPLGLDADVRVHGLYPPSAVSDRPGRDLEALARRLARIVVELHERGVYMRDIAPKNIVVDGAKAGGVSIVDFGFAWYQDFYLPGATRGYAPARQVRAEPPRDTDDLHALGMTLLFATLGIEPVEIGDDWTCRVAARSRHCTAPSASGRPARPARSPTCSRATPTGLGPPCGGSPRVRRATGRPPDRHSRRRASPRSWLPRSPPLCSATCSTRRGYWWARRTTARARTTRASTAAAPASASNCCGTRPATR